METIISSIISGAVTLAVCMINGMVQKKVSQTQYEETISLIEYKLNVLTKRVEQHNNLIDRTYKLEELDNILFNVVVFCLNKFIKLI